MKYSSYQLDHNKRHGVLAAGGVLMLIGMMVWLAGVSRAAENNTANNNGANEPVIDWDRLQAEVDDQSGLTTRLNEIGDRENDALNKINEKFNKEVEDILDNDKLSEKSRNNLLKQALKRKSDAAKRVKENATRERSLADGTFKAQRRSASKIIRTYQSGGYWQTPTPPSSGSSGGSKPIVLPCVDLDSIKPKLPGGTVPLTGATTTPATLAR